MIVRIIEDIMPPDTVLILFFPFILKAGIGYPNLSILRKMLNICKGDSLLNIAYELSFGSLS